MRPARPHLHGEANPHGGTGPGDASRTSIRLARPDAGQRAADPRRLSTGCVDDHVSADPHEPQEAVAGSDTTPFGAGTRRGWTRRGRRARSDDGAGSGRRPPVRRGVRGRGGPRGRKTPCADGRAGRRWGLRHLSEPGSGQALASLAIWPRACARDRRASWWDEWVLRRWPTEEPGG